MSKLSQYIDSHCRDFEVFIRSVNTNHSVFIEITDLKTSAYNNIDVALGQELEGLTFLISEWDFMIYPESLKESVN